MLVGVPPGGSTDLVARIVASEFLKTFGQPVIIDNRPGAGHSIASAIVVKSAPNGYTLQMVNANHTQNPFIVDNLPYDTQRDFAPITQVVTQPLVLIVNASVPVASVKELIAMAKGEARHADRRYRPAPPVPEP
jgi:tripartite-type tricarboxylate transporter receptor subunit TctC